LAQMFAPKKDGNGRAYWDNEGDEERMPELAPPLSGDGEAHRWWPAGRQVQR